MADKKNAAKQLPPGTKSSGKKGGTWDSLDLLPSVTNVIKNVLNFTSMTPVQSATIPNFLEHKDVAVEAPTGSGKTIAFVVPILERLLRLPSPLKKSEVGAMVITPTRELAHQICEVFHSFLDTINAELPEEDPKRLSVWRLTGGSDEGEDMKFLRTHGGHIIVATPGRLEHTLKKAPDLRLKTLEVLVLDEADSLLEMGFEASISSILNRLPKQRRTGLFSATMTKKVTNLVKAGMRNPVKIGVQVQSTPATSSSVPTDRFQASASSVKHSSTAPTQVTPTTLSNHYLLIEADTKLSFLVHFLQTLAKQASENDGAGCKVIIFFATIASVKYFRSVLTHFKVLPESIPVLGTHSDVPQKKREQIRQTFTEQRAAVLLSTDVTARGVDIPDVDWVVQFDPPKDPDDFIHRSGRTARNGRSGNALLFLLPSEESYIELMTQKGVPLSPFPATNDLFSITIDPSKLKSADWREEIEDQNAMDTDGNNNPESSATSTTKLPADDDDDRPNYVLKRKSKPVELAPHTHPYLKGMTDYTPKLRQLSCSDRAMMDAGILAFISFVAAYKEHKASFSFRLSQLDFGALAKLFGLLKLPRMVEFAPSKVQNFEPMDIDLESIKYADKKREKDRQARIQKDAAAAEASAPSKGGRKFGFSAEDFGKTSDAEESEEAEEEESSSSEELDDFASEAALLKKLKRGKISEATYDRLTGNNDLDAEIGGGAASRGNGQHSKPNHKKRNFSGPRDGDGNASSSLSKHKKFKKR